MTELQEADAAGCVECGSTQGPDLRARSDSGDLDLETWARCGWCKVPLCDGCAAAGTHRCDQAALPWYKRRRWRWMHTESPPGPSHRSGSRGPFIPEPSVAGMITSPFTISWLADRR
jgi:hypothetical protein